MNPEPATELSAVIATACVGTVGWSVGQVADLIGFVEITKDDLLGPMGALVGMTIAVIYFANRQRKWDAREEQREARREQLIEQITSIAEGSKAAIEAMHDATTRFEQTAQTQIKVLKAVEKSVASCQFKHPPLAPPQQP